METIDQEEKRMMDKRHDLIKGLTGKISSEEKLLLLTTCQLEIIGRKLHGRCLRLTNKKSAESHSKRLYE